MSTVKLTKTKEYVEFCKRLSSVQVLLDELSSHCVSQPEITITNSETLLLFGHSFDSAIQTLKSIMLCSEIGNFSDSFTLARKYRDDLLQYLFILDTLSNKLSGAESLLKQYDGKEINVDVIFEIVNILVEGLSSGEIKRPVDIATDAWLKNELENKDHTKTRRQYFDTSKYLSSLLDSNKLVNECYESFFAGIWNDVDRTLNNYVHANGKKYIASNIINYTYPNRKIYFDSLEHVVLMSTAITLSFIILIKPEYISATDHIDSLDLGIEPDEGSQFWISGCVQAFIDETVVSINPDLKKYLSVKNPFGMNIV